MMETTKPCNQQDFYVKYDQAPFEEDALHEFKGHRNICNEDLPKFTRETKYEKGSRKSISRNLCGFLNTGVGGTVYCGILDNGTVHGLKLSQYQRDHIIGAMHDLMSRFSPPVDKRRYRIKFVPVLGSASEEEKHKHKMANVDAKGLVNQTDRRQPHVYRTAHYCWCDKDMMAQFQHGIFVSDYVIELTILPWHPGNEAIGGLGSILNLHPIHADEEGKIYFRRQASLVQYNTTEIANLSRYEASNRCQSIIESLKKEIAREKELI